MREPIRATSQEEVFHEVKMKSIFYNIPIKLNYSTQQMLYVACP